MVIFAQQQRSAPCVSSSKRTVLRRFTMIEWWLWMLLLLIAMVMMMTWTVHNPTVEYWKERRRQDEITFVVYHRSNTTTMEVEATPSNNHTPPSEKEEGAAPLQKALGLFPMAGFADSKIDSNSANYVADPTALRNGIASFLQQTTAETKHSLWYNTSQYWNVLQHYQSQYRRDALYGNVSLTTNNVCSDPPGQGWEGGMEAFTLLTQKIALASVPPLPRERLLCVMYTHAPKMRDLARTAALTWGAQCDGFLAFSNETVPRLGTVHLLHAGPESYGNMWQKTRSLLLYLYQHYINDYDYYHIGGDDIFLLVPNLRHFIASLPLDGTPVFAGQWIRQKNRPYVGGGPGYTLNRSALRYFMWQRYDNCHANVTASYEDRLLSQCLKGFPLTDTRDAHTGEQRYHDCPPQQVYTHTTALASTSRRRRPNFHAAAASYWERLPWPNATVVADAPSSSPQPWQMVLSAASAVGPKYGLQAAAPYSVSFHKIHHPLFQARLHAILYPGVCPPDSPLRRPNTHTHHLA